MDAPEPDFYLDLGIPQTSTQSQIRKAYHRLAILHHPDKKAPGEKVDAAEFRKIHAAYNFLSDAAKRGRYDLRYTLVQRRWTQYRSWEEAGRQRQAKQEELDAKQEELDAKQEELKRQKAEAEKVRVAEENERRRKQEEAARRQAEAEAEARRARYQQEADFASQQDASAVTPCVHAHIGKVWWKNGKASCAFCCAEDTFCYGCPVCDVFACPDCRTDLPC